MKSEEFSKQLSDYYVIKEPAPLSYGVLTSGLFITLQKILIYYKVITRNTHIERVAKLDVTHTFH